MKKLILSVACCGIILFTTFTPAPVAAQTSSTTTTHTTTTMKDKDGTIKMVNGKMMVMTKGSWTAMTMDKTLSNGTKVMTNGTVVMKDGSKKTLMEGECVKPDGTIQKKM